MLTEGSTCNDLRGSHLECVRSGNLRKTGGVGTISEDGCPVTSSSESEEITTGFDDGERGNLNFDDGETSGSVNDGCP